MLEYRNLDVQSIDIQLTISYVERDSDAFLKGREDDGR